MPIPPKQAPMNIRNPERYSPIGYSPFSGNLFHVKDSVGKDLLIPIDDPEINAAEACSLIRGYFKDLSTKSKLQNLDA